MSREKWSCVSLGCFALLLLLALEGLESPLRVRRGFLEGVFCSVGRSAKGRFRLFGGGEVKSEVGEDGRRGLVFEERVLYVLRKSADIVWKERGGSEGSGKEQG